MGFLQSLERALGLREDEDEDQIARYNPDQAYNQAVLDAKLKRETAFMDEGLDEMDAEVAPPDAVDTVADAINEDSQSAEAPELPDTKPEPVDFTEAVEQNVLSYNKSPEEVSAQRDRVEAAGAEREQEAIAANEDAKAYSEYNQDIRQGGFEQTGEAPELPEGLSDAELADLEVGELEPDDSALSPEMVEENPEQQEMDEDRAMALFETTHGGEFDPNSSMDKGKMEIIKQQMEKDPSLSEIDDEEFQKRRNAFALSIYRL